MTAFVGRACSLAGRACRDLTCAALALWLAAEAIHRRAERHHVPASAPETLLVLGYPSDKHGRPSPLQHPERADELHAAELYRFGEHPLLKVATAGYEVVLRGLRYRPTGSRIWQRIGTAR